jgi:hypothetical protein
MKVLIGCDVDPVLPALLRLPPSTDIWEPLDLIYKLVGTMGDALPVITWLIRSDESIRFCTGSYSSGFISRQKLWRSLANQGHELGWHMHNLSFDGDRGCFGFDPDPSWLSAAHHSLTEHYPVRTTRIGWDYGSTGLLNALDKLGIQIDLSALPGNIVWHSAGPDRITVDWRRCPSSPYHPDRHDYQTEGPNALRLLEVPITQFPNSLRGVATRCVRRISNCCFSMSGLRHKTLRLTDPWPVPPVFHGGILAFFFHAEELTEIGVSHFAQNVQQLRQMHRVEFVTANQIAVM